MRLSELWEQFTVYILIEQGGSERTVAAYRTTMFMLIDLIGDVDAAHVSTQALRRFLVALNQQHDYAPATIHKYIAALHSIFRFAYRQEIIADDPASRLASPQVPRALPNYFTEGELRQFLLTPCKPYKWRQPYGALRDRAIFFTLAYTGARARELLAMNCQDIDLAQQVVILRKTKNKRERVVPITKAVADLLFYVLMRRIKLPWADPPSKEPALWLSMVGHRMCYSLLLKAFHRHLAHCGIDRPLTPHSLRHSFATLLLKGGANLRSIQTLLGHVSIQSTMIYTHVDVGDLREAVEKHPLLTQE